MIKINESVIEANRLTQSIHALKEMCAKYEFDGKGPQEKQLMELDGNLWHLMYVLENAFEEAILYIAHNHMRHNPKAIKEATQGIVVSEIMEWVEQLECKEGFLIRFYEQFDGPETESINIECKTEFEAHCYAEGYAKAKDYATWEID